MNTSEQTYFSGQYLPSNTGRVVILDHNGNISEYLLSKYGKERIVFGREKSSDIIIESDLVSRTHGEFIWRNGAWHLNDLGSKNGTYVNAELLSASNSDGIYGYCLEEGDIIRIDNIIPGAAKRHGIIMIFTMTESVGKWKKFDLAAKNRVTIGRNETCDIVLSNVSVSRLHAEIFQYNGYLVLRDLNSFNGVFVNGIRIVDEHILYEKDILRFANSVAIFSDGILFYKSDNGGTRVEIHDVSRSVKTKYGDKCILSDVNLTIEPNEFVAIIGGSGAGKSTVMNAMSGFEKATQGHVLVNSVDLYENYNVLKNIIGYVPQQEIIYENLTLMDMLDFSAKLRMPEDISEAERKHRISEVLKMVELTEHSDTMIRELSGGQKKRASIAVELLADPGLFFLDEPTSGLDPGTEESLMLTLSGLSGDKGKTIIMVTHTTQNLHLCDKVLFMGKGGKVCYYGSPDDCLKFFGTDSLTKVYNMLNDDYSVDLWMNKFYASYRRKSKAVNISGQNNLVSKKPMFLRQLVILCHRYMTLIKNDWQRLIMLLLQPIGITVLLSLVAGENVFVNYEDSRSILFATTCGAIWIALFNSIQEICKERNILKREYMANLRIGAYILSKFVVQLILCAVQMIIIALLFKLLIGWNKSSIITDSGLLENYITLTLTAFASSAIGLLVSSVSKNPDKAMTVAPFILIIQLLFSGILFPLGEYTKFLSYFTVSRWSVSGLGIAGNLNALPSKVVVPGLEREAESIFEFTAHNIINVWLILFLFVIVCMVCCVIVLRNVKNDLR